MQKIYIILFIASIVFTGCSKKDSAASLFNKAQSQIEKKDFSGAIKNLRTLAEGYPDHTLAPEAQYKLGDAFMAYANDFEQAIDEYRLVVEKYRDSISAVNAQFMIGYIYANYLNDTVSAREEYEKFLNNFSDRADSSLIQSVNFELQYLGKELKDIPQLKHISS